jgi:hypothetical protein
LDNPVVTIENTIYNKHTKTSADSYPLDTISHHQDIHSQHQSTTTSPHTFNTAAMCRKTIYYNTYGDGSEDVTERVDTCRPGKMCSHPERRELSRNFRFSKLAEKAMPETPSSIADRKPTPYHTDFLELPPTPRSKTPSPARKHESGIYVNGAKIADIHAKREQRPSSRRDPVVVHAPEPPSPRPFFKRSSTMPTSQHIVVEERGRRHRDSLAEPHRTSSREIPVGPVRIIESLGSNHRSNSGSRRSASPRPTYYREHTRSARGYAYRDEEKERKEHIRPSRRASSFYGDSDFTSSSRRTEDVYMTPPPAVQLPTPPKKELRWEDEVRARQNERIARRPKLHQEVKGILKKEEPAAQYDELRRAVGKMDIHSTQQRRVREGDDPRYWDRLRDRFEEPRERRRRSKVYYPGEGLYKYM